MKRLVLVAVMVACGDDTTTSPTGPHVLMDFSRATSLYDAPFPSDDLLAGTTVDAASIPNPSNVALVEQVRALVAERDGFAVTGAVFFATSEPIDPATLPTIAASVAADSPTFVIGIDPAAPDYGVRYPLEVSFEPVPSKYAAPNLIALLPIQGMPLRPGTRYAAVVTTAIRTPSTALIPAPGDALARFPDAITAVNAAGVASSQIAGITAFTTGNPTAGLALAHAAALARPLPVIDAPFARTDLFTDFCVYHTTIAMPDWQTGVPPYTDSGGTWQLDAAGAPIFQRTETANLVVTIPRTPVPGTGYPLVVFVRTGGGGDRPLVDRGQQPAEGMPPIIPGEGPARYLARAGFAGIEVDGPLGGLRNTTGGDEQFLTFNVTNLGAMRDNIRESALELDVIAHYGIALQLATADCPGASATATFDANHVAIMGHSMGSWIAPLAASVEPSFRALILSGAGGSWIENIMYKKKPTPVYPAISTFLQVSDLKASDPAMTFAQWALEAADPQVYGASIVREPINADPRHVLMVQGIVDDYILPRIANATSLSMGLALAGPELDTSTDPRLVDELPVGPLMMIAGSAPLTLPATANVVVNGRPTTAILTQHAEDGIEDGHEVLFQTDAPKHEYQCFLASWLATGVPTVAADASRDAPCP